MPDQKKVFRFVAVIGDGFRRHWQMMLWCWAPKNYWLPTKLPKSQLNSWVHSFAVFVLGAFSPDFVSGKHGRCGGHGGKRWRVSSYCRLLWSLNWGKNKLQVLVAVTTHSVHKNPIKHLSLTLTQCLIRTAKGAMCQRLKKTPVVHFSRLRVHLPGVSASGAATHVTPGSSVRCGILLPVLR